MPTDFEYLKRRNVNMKMVLDKEIKEKLLEIDWLVHCGNQEVIGITNNYVYIKDTEDIRKMLKSVKWDNICNKAIGDLTEYLSIHHSKKYHFWNPMVDEAKDSIIANNSDIVKERCKILGIPEEMFYNIRMDIVNIALAYSYKEYYESEFYKDMLKIYELGHLPCGWVGSYSNGKFKVY